MVLTVDGVRSRVLKPFDAFSFDGAANTRCELLGGAIRDFNLIYAADRVAARMRWVTVAQPEPVVSSAQKVLVFNTGEGVAVTVAGTMVAELGHHDCLELDADRERLALELTGVPVSVCAVVELSGTCGAPSFQTRWASGTPGR